MSAVTTDNAKIFSLLMSKSSCSTLLQSQRRVGSHGTVPPLRAPMDTRIPPRGLNPSLLALVVDLRYSNSIFVCRLVVTENILRRAIAPLAPLATPLAVVHCKAMAHRLKTSDLCFAPFIFVFVTVLVDVLYSTKQWTH